MSTPTKPSIVFPGTMALTEQRQSQGGGRAG
jgi:hypothetical protein